MIRRDESIIPKNTLANDSTCSNALFSRYSRSSERSTRSGVSPCDAYARRPYFTIAAWIAASVPLPEMSAIENDTASLSKWYTSTMSPPV